MPRRSISETQTGSLQEEQIERLATNISKDGVRETISARGTGISYRTDPILLVAKAKTEIARICLLPLAPAREGEMNSRRGVRSKSGK